MDGRFAAIAWSSNGKHIAAVRLLDDRNQEIRIYTPDGSQNKRLCDGLRPAAYSSECVVWAPDSRRILWTGVSRKPGSGESNLWLTDVNDPKPKQLTFFPLRTTLKGWRYGETHTFHAYGPEWSPDRRWVFFTGGGSSGGGIGPLLLDTHNPGRPIRRLAERIPPASARWGELEELVPVWNPRTGELVFGGWLESANRNGFAVWNYSPISDRAGARFFALKFPFQSRDADIHSASPSAFPLAISPDGKWLVMLSHLNGTGENAWSLLELASGRIEATIAGPAPWEQLSVPLWYLDSRSLGYAVPETHPDRAGVWRLYRYSLVDRTKEDLGVIQASGVYGAVVAWSPDGSAIAFAATSKDGKHGALFVLPLRISH